MLTVQKSLRIPKDIIEEIEEVAKDSGRDFTSAANELLTEGIKAHRCPGVVFSEGVSGKRARIAGTGIEVWELIAAYKSVKEDYKRLRKTYHWLTEQQIKSAIGYYGLYAEEIERLISENEGVTAEVIKKKLPFLAGAGR